MGQEEKSKAQTKQKPSNTKKPEEEPEKPVKKIFVAGELEATKTPLIEATVFLKPLQDLLPGKIETHLAAFEISYRKEKTLLMLQALKRCFAIDQKHPKVRENIKKYSAYVKSKELSRIVQGILEANDLSVCTNDL